MPLTDELKTSYELVLRDLETERQQVQDQLGSLQNRLKELHNSISTLSKRINPDAPPSQTFTPSHPPNQKYANMSVRWAILHLLNDSKPRTTAEIAEALLAGGIETKAANFANNVSAVLTTTMKEAPHNEVQQLQDGKWELTENGESAIEHISTKYGVMGRGRYRRSLRF
ncbi:MAG TPA: hypothetical protein VFA85_09600 [Terriglobales bacterium]|nr:hypothetical protein [Terriglobales bacterium]